jgi:hypothetical protein
MLSNYAKERLVQTIADQDVADEIEKRLIQSSPASAQDAQDLLDSFSSELDLEEYCSVAFANAEVGAEISGRIEKAKAVLEAKANGVGSPAVAASFEGQVAGMTTDVTIEADNAGIAGNSILLVGDGVKDIDTLISDWNTANPSNTASLAAGDGSQVPDALEEIQLADGSDASDSDLAAALASFGSEELSEEAFDHAVIALADEEAAEEFKEYYNQFVSAVSSIS